MNRLLGIFVMVALLYAVLMASDEHARSLNTHLFIARRLGFYGVLTLGVGVLIISGGIDLSIGSVVGLGAILFGLMLQHRVPPALALAAVVLGGAAIGLWHGLLVTRLGLQPFLVTLCGLFIYRGLARFATATTVGLAPDAPEAYRAQIEFLRTWLVREPLGVPQQLLVLLALAVVLGLFLQGTRHGRYLFAIGANEQAARYAGIPTDRYKVLAYVLCSALAGLASGLELLESRSAQPSSVGQLYELYAITGAVLGGCSLSGGEGSVAGMVLGAAVLPMLRLLCNFSPALSNEMEYVVIGFALLLGTIVDEVLKRRSLRRAA